MTSRLILTATWLLFLVADTLIIMSYSNGFIIYPIELIDHLKPLFYLYGPYISGILVFWYVKPFHAVSDKKIERIRFYLALLLTLLLNLLVFFFVIHYYLSKSSIILSDVKTGVTIAGLLSFLVAPANAYYFGMKMR